MGRNPAVYMLASRRNGTPCTGVTGNLIERVWQHRNHLASGFTDRYDVTLLAWYELHGTREAAIAREQRLKKWNRAWRISLVEDSNPCWNDLWPRLTGRGQDTGSPLWRG